MLSYFSVIIDSFKIKEPSFIALSYRNAILIFDYLKRRLLQWLTPDGRTVGKEGIPYGHLAQAIFFHSHFFSIYNLYVYLRCRTLYQQESRGREFFHRSQAPLGDVLFFD
jgi:hypothetical protein